MARDLDLFHPELRAAARRVPGWLPQLRSRRGLRVARRVGRVMYRRPVALRGAIAHSTAYGELVTPTERTADGGALLWIHGGGLVMGSPVSELERAARYVRTTGAVVLACRYRLAPEHPYPAAIDDCVAALDWLRARSDVDPARVVVGGDSAGGGLAAALALVDRGRGAPPLRGQLLLAPMLDDRTGREQQRAPGHVFWSPATNQFAWSSYLGVIAGSEAIPGAAAPARERLLESLPAAWMGVGTLDLFLHETVDYAERLRAAGVACELRLVPGGFHGFDTMAADTSVALDWSRDQEEWLRERLAPDDV